MKVERPLCHLWEFTPKTLSDPYGTWHNACLTYTYLHAGVESSLGNLQSLLQLNAVHTLVRLYCLRKDDKEMVVIVCSVQVQVVFMHFPP